MPWAQVSLPYGWWFERTAELKVPAVVNYLNPDKVFRPRRDLFLWSDFQRHVATLFNGVKNQAEGVLVRWELRNRSTFLDMMKHFPGPSKIVPWWYLTHALSLQENCSSLLRDDTRGILPTNGSGGLLFLGGENAHGKGVMHLTHLQVDRSFTHPQWHLKKPEIDKTTYFEPGQVLFAPLV